MAELQSRSELLDAVNSRLLRELHDDPRITMSALARRVGMSAPAVTERVQRLQRSGVITGFRMEVDPAALGLPVTAFARIRPTAGQLDRIAALAREIGQVSECHRITGEDCFLVKVHVARIQDLLETGSFMGAGTVGVLMPADRSIDLDTLEDFAAAEASLAPARP